MEKTTITEIKKAAKAQGITITNRSATINGMPTYKIECDCVIYTKSDLERKFMGAW